MQYLQLKLTDFVCLIFVFFVPIQIPLGTDINSEVKKLDH
jgi:hypothetical protein